MTKPSLGGIQGIALVGLIVHTTSQESINFTDSDASAVITAFCGIFNFRPNKRLLFQQLMLSF